MIPFQVNFPNFITSGKVTKANFINSMKDKNKFKGSMLLIENADPGYDWILV